MAVFYDVKEQLQRAKRASCLYPGVYTCIYILTITI